MSSDPRLRSLALRLLDTAETLAEQRALPLQAIIHSADSTEEQRFEALRQLALLSQEIVRKLLIIEDHIMSGTPETLESPNSEDADQTGESG